MTLPEKQVYLAQTGSGRIAIPLTDPDSFLADEDDEGLIQEARLKALKAALDEGEASLDVEDFDPERFLQELKDLRAGLFIYKHFLQLIVVFQN